MGPWSGRKKDATCKTLPTCKVASIIGCNQILRGSRICPYPCTQRCLQYDLKSDSIWGPLPCDLEQNACPRGGNGNINPVSNNNKPNRIRLINPLKRYTNGTVIKKCQILEDFRQELDVPFLRQLTVGPGVPIELAAEVALLPMFALGVELQVNASRTKVHTE